MPRITTFAADGVTIISQVLPTLAEAQDEARARLELQLASEVAKGMPWQGKVLQIDDVSRGHLAASCLRARSGTLPTPFAWRMADNSMLPLDAAGMMAMAEAAMDHYLALRQQFWVACNAIAAAGTVAACDAIQLAGQPVMAWP